MKSVVVIGTRDAGRFVMTSLLVLALWHVELSAQTLEFSLRDDNGEPVSEAVIEVLLPESERSNYQSSASFTIDQQDKEFVPHITTAVAGSEISFPNSDAILHHVYSFSPARTFNIPLYGRGENDGFFETFPEPGVVEIGCNIHDWMLAYIYIGETTLMGVTDDEGKVVLHDLPEGEFQLRIWHARLDAVGNLMQTPLSLQAGQASSVSLQVSLQRDRRIRRAPSANRTRYR